MAVAAKVASALGHQRVLRMHQRALNLGGFAGDESIQAAHALIQVNFGIVAPPTMGLQSWMIMTNIKQRLFEAFRKDHAILGRGLYDMEMAISGGDAARAKALADQLDWDVGAHIAFEEYDFYPALKVFLSKAEVEKMYAEHADGARTLADVVALNADAPISTDVKDRLLSGVREMEHHVSECGELFGALGGVSEEEMESLYARLESWRRKAPRWSELAESKQQSRAD
ncbi:MAG: hemerythrin domain-containing protein [Rhizobiales bacterium]|nr:hemerythrin domain-containing protein [Hyphomicrobiales bacterium]MBO6955414.1 hemerythrin domain-containing protein [Hyphomicrobiales bacterium]